MNPDDFSAWPAQEPPPDFADGVLERLRREGREPEARIRSRRTIARRGAVLLLAAALLSTGIWAATRSIPNRAGDVVATERREVRIGDRAVAVLERGAHVVWDGDAVSQVAGEVFYRVEPGGPFDVRTAAGDVAVKGTCFRVKVSEGEETNMAKRDLLAGATGAALALTTVVGVYEGKVALADRRGGSVDVRAGESAVSDARGARALGSLADAEAKGDTPDENPVMVANRSLADSVRTYRRRLDTLESEKKSLEERLSDAERRIAAATEAGQPVPIDKDAFDLSPDDWRELAKKSSVKVKTPCDARATGWTPSPEALNKAGLSPEDAKPLMDAYDRSAKRLWGAIKPLCAEVVGSDAVAEKLGRESCIHLIANLDENVSRDAFRRVAEIRAGDRPMPAPNEKVPAVERVFLTTTAEMKLFEEDLSQTFGPEEAHRIAFGTSLCFSKGQWTE
jgi:ferric-dicitrate binding protein FerR (iron transport regulator)